MLIKILGNPMATQSVRFTMTGHRYKDKKVLDWQNNVKAQIVHQLPKDFKPYSKPVIIKRLLFAFSIPKSTPKFIVKNIEDGFPVYKTTKPDIDNLCKNFFDSMNGIVFITDAQIVLVQEISKIVDFTPRIEIVIEELQC